MDRTASNNPREQQMPLPWRYELGAYVSWSAAQNAQKYVITRRRYDQGHITAFAQYLLYPSDAPEQRGQWAYEPDILPWGESL